MSNSELTTALRRLDAAGDGLVNRSVLAEIFKGLDDWSQADLADLFDGFDSTKSGRIPIQRFVEWISGGPDRKPIGIPSASDGPKSFKSAMAINAFSPQQKLSGSRAIEEKKVAPKIDDPLMHWCVTATEFLVIFLEMERSPEEAEDMFDDCRTQMGLPVGSTIPLYEFLDDLQIELKDTEAMQALSSAAAVVKERHEAALTIVRESMSEASKAKLERQLVETVLTDITHTLETTGRPAEDAWKVVEEGLVNVSRSGQKVIEAFASKQDELIETVKKYMIAPPLLPCGSGTSCNRERARAEVNAIITACRASGDKFTDTTWDSRANTNEVYYVDKKAPGYDCTVAAPAGFKRLTEIYDSPVLFDGGSKPDDIHQGQIGTCFLLGAIGAVAAEPGDAIRKLFIHYDVEVGVYAVRMCLNGEWTYIIVDDWLPVNQHGQLLFARCSGNELWCPLLEKAYCKFHTCYEMCDGGNPTTAIFTFWGGANGKLAVEKSHKADPTSFFPLLQKACDQGWLLTNTFKNLDVKAPKAGKCGEAVLDSGLVGGHVYSILKVVEANGEQLVCCRNPWGTGEWTGKWSDRNDYGEWTEEIVAATGYVDYNDGTFYMSIADFVASVGTVHYARTFGPQWNQVTHYGRFKSDCATAKALWAWQGRSKDELTIAAGDTLCIEDMTPGWWKGTVEGKPDASGYFPWNYVALDDRPVARFDLSGEAKDGHPMEVVINLVQPNVYRKRQFYTRDDGQIYKDVRYERLQLLIIDEGGNVVVSKEGAYQVITGSITLPAGSHTWKIYAVSVGGAGCSFFLRCYMKGCHPNASLTEVDAGLSEIASLL